MITEYRYMEMLDVTIPNTKKKTKIFRVISKSSKDVLGHILWSGAWRQYVFETITDYPCIFSRSCMEDIKHFINQLMEERLNKDGRRNNKRKSN